MKVVKTILFHFCLVFDVFVWINAQSSNVVYTELIEHLTNRHRNRHVIPTNLTSRCMRVRFGLRLVQVSLNEKKNVMQSSIWVRYKWIDESLIWNRTKYNIERVVFPTDSIWLPDINLVNTDETSVSERHSHEVSVLANGRVFWVVQRYYRSGCLLDLTNYPFDTHVCEMWFQSLVHREDDLCVDSYGPSPPFDLDTYLSSYKRSGEWKLSNNQSDVINRPRDIGAYLVFSRRRSLKFSIKLDRQAGFSAYLLMIPPLILAALTIVVFFLPADSSDRNTLATSLFGSFMVLLLVLVQTAPSSSASVPILGIFYVVNMIAIMLTVILSAAVCRIRNRTGPVPLLLKKLMYRKLGRILLYGSSSTASAQESNTSPYSVDHTDNIENCTHSNIPDQLEDVTSVKKRISKIEINGEMNIDEKKGSTGKIPLVPDWILVGNLLDRIFIIVYIVLFIASIVFFYPTPS